MSCTPKAQFEIMFQIRAGDKKVTECFETMLSIGMHLLFTATHSIIIYQKNSH